MRFCFSDYFHDMMFKAAGTVSLNFKSKDNFILHFGPTLSYLFRILLIVSLYFAFIFLINYLASTTHIIIPSSYSIPTANAEWNQESTILVNPLGRCLSDENSLCGAQDLFIDNIHDNLYVVDTGNNRIQKYSLIEPFDPQQGSIGVTVASKDLIQPQSIFVDSQTEDMYILDHKSERDSGVYSSDYRVLLWKKNDEIGKKLFSEIGERSFEWRQLYLILDKEMNIYVVARHCVTKWLSSTKYTRQVIVAGKNERSENGKNDLWNPRAFYIDDNLTLYISDWHNNRIQKWLFNATEGITLANNLTYVHGLTMDCNGHIYYTGMNDRLIYRFNPINNQTTIIIDQEKRFQYVEPFFPTSIKLDKYGNIFVIAYESGATQIRKFSII